MPQNKKIVSLAKVQEYAKNISNITATVHPVKAKEFIQESKNWYKNANKLCKQISSELNLDVKLVAAVFAALSPNQSWLVQERHTKKFIEDILNGIDYKETGYGYYANRKKAKSILTSKIVFPHLSGQKVTAFYYNIIGKYSIPTIDIWAIRVALNDFSLTSAQCGKYMRNFYGRDEIVQAYELAAKKHKLPVAVMQSLTWCIGRDIVSKELV